MPMPQGAECLKCSYPVWTIRSEICPECGTRFDAGDPRTFRRGAPIPYARLLVPRIAQLPLALILFLVYLNDATMPITDVTDFLTGSVFAVLSLPLMFWLIVSIAARYRAECRLARANPPPVRAIRFARIGLVALALAILGFAYGTRDPARWRFRTCRASFEQVARSITSGRGAPPGPFWIGTYRIGNVSRDGERIKFSTAMGQGLLDNCAIEYRPGADVDGGLDQIALTWGTQDRRPSAKEFAGV
jgi:hypothetical protein